MGGYNRYGEWDEYLGNDPGYDPEGSSGHEPTNTSYDPGDWWKYSPADPNSAPASFGSPALDSGLYGAWVTPEPPPAVKPQGQRLAGGTGSRSSTSVPSVPAVAPTGKSAGAGQALNEPVYTYNSTEPTTTTTTRDPTTTTSVTSPTTSTTSGSTTNISQRIPTMALPQYEEAAALSLPARDALRERYLAQEEQALGVGEWRQSLRKGLNKLMSEGNFATRGAQMRELFAGAGQGLGRILQAASSAARAIYNAEYGILVTQAVENYRGQLSEHLAKFNSEVGMYLGTMDTSTTGTSTQNTYTSGSNTTQVTSGGTTKQVTSGGSTSGYRGNQPYDPALNRPGGYGSYGVL